MRRTLVLGVPCIRASGTATDAGSRVTGSAHTLAAHAEGRLAPVSARSG